MLESTITDPTSFKRFTGTVSFKYKSIEKKDEVSCLTKEIIKRIYPQKTEYAWTYRWPEPSRTTGAYTLYTAQIILENGITRGSYESDCNTLGTKSLICTGIEEKENSLIIQGEWYENTYIYDFKLEALEKNLKKRWDI